MHVVVYICKCVYGVLYTGKGAGCLLVLVVVVVGIQVVLIV